MAERKLPAGPVAVIAVALCCAIPALVVLAGGLAATMWGAAVRFWPVTSVGVALAAFGGTRLARRTGGSRNP